MAQLSLIRSFTNVANIEHSKSTLAHLLIQLTGTVADRHKAVAVTRRGQIPSLSFVLELKLPKERLINGFCCAEMAA